MLFYNFGDYEGFKERFGLRDCGNGEKSRRNKILLAYVKSPRLLHRAVKDMDYLWEINIPTMNVLWESLKSQLYERSYHYAGGTRWAVCGVVFYTKKFERDDYDGLCEDGDARAIRYVNSENSRVFKMKAGKFMRKVCEECGLAELWPEQVLVWFCEEFAGKWQSYATGRLPGYELHVDDSEGAFRRIYDQRSQVGDFHSCMNNNNVHMFYSYSVDAKAAWLENDDGNIVARCVIFTQVEDCDTGEILRLAERQYSSDCSDLLKRVLVDKLIDAGEIDGYKRVGADCHNARAFVSNEGVDWSNRDFKIKCQLDYDSPLSYQDSFKWWDECAQVAYNCDSYGYDEMLDTTEGRLEGSNYDDWNNEYTHDDLVTVYYNGRAYQCSDQRLDEFVYVECGNGQYEYHHEDDVAYCDDIDEYVLEEDAVYSTLTDKTYYYEDNMRREEQEYKELHWYYSEYDDDYYKDVDDVVILHRADGVEMTISVDSLENHFEYEERDGKYYELVEEEVEAA